MTAVAKIYVTEAEYLARKRAAGTRSGKFQQHQHVETLPEYLLVTQDAPRIERFKRDGAHWRYERIDGLQAVLMLDTPPLQVPLAEINEGLDVSGVAEPSPPLRS